MHTEQEAAEKWCPQVLHRVYGCLGSHCMWWRWGEYSIQNFRRYEAEDKWTRKAEPPRPADLSPSWEWRPGDCDMAGHWREPESEAATHRRGYCGAAGNFPYPQ